MNRLLTLASTGLFATGLAILPLSVNAATATETKPPVTASVAGPDGKAAPVVKPDTVAKDAPKPNTAMTAPATTAPVTTAPVTAATTAPATATAKPATTQPPAHDAVQAPVPSGSPAKVGG